MRPNALRRRLPAALLGLSLLAAGCPPPAPPAPPGGNQPPPQAGTDPMTSPPPHGDTGTGTSATDGPPAPAPAEVKPLAADALASVDEPTVKAWVGPALAQPAAAFKPVAKDDKLLTAPLAESSGATGQFLQAEVDPYRGAKGGTWTVRRDPDLVRCQYKAGDLACVLTEGANFLTLEVTPKDPLTPGSLRALIKRVARLEVKSDGVGGERSWKVEVPDGADLSKGSHRFGNPGAPPVLEVASRDDRIDVLVADGRVFLVFYKKIEQLVGFGPESWLDPASRKKMTGR